jgi:AraC-like DNA-binding protein
MNEGMIRVAPLLPSRQVLARLGVDWGDVLDECGLHPDLFAHPDNPIAFADLCRFVRLGANASRCEHFGLLLAHEASVATLGAVGLGALKGAQVGSVLAAMIRNLHLHDQGAVPFLTVDGGKACFGYLVADYHPCGVSVVLDGAVGIIHRIVASLCGPNWRPLEVGFARRQPRDVAPYIEFFGVPLNFDATYTGVVFRERDLHKRVQFARPAAPPDGAFAAAEQASVPFPILIRRLLQVLLVTERCTVAEVADLLDMHRRTLNRRLAAMGVTFRDLADEAAYVRARQLLAETDMPLAKLANAMGYAEVSTFSCRFRHRSGIPPGQWRKQFRHEFVVPS